MLRSVSPLPKKMPRPSPKAPKAAVVCPNPKIFLKPKAKSPGVSLKPSSKASVIGGKTPRVALIPNLSSLPLPSNQVYARARPSSAPKYPGILSSPKIHVTTEGQAMKILARHSARLGPLGTKLETAVREIVSAAGRLCATTAVGDFTERWDFLVCKDGLARYQNLRQRFTEIYKRTRFYVEADKEVLSQVGVGESSPSSSANMAAVPPPSKRVAPGQRLRLPVLDVRFAHNDQSERFGNSASYNDSSSGSILQLTAELLAGLTDPARVPTFSVCWFEGHWYCRTGNRRLAAFRLAHLLAPMRFRDIDVWVVEADTVFVRGAPGKKPKLTTNLNGARCLGRWLVVRETGEVVGHGKPGHAQYGVDLLALLPLAACTTSMDAESEEDEQAMAGGA